MNPISDIVGQIGKRLSHVSAELHSFNDKIDYRDISKIAFYFENDIPLVFSSIGLNELAVSHEGR